MTIEEHRPSSSLDDTPGLVQFTYSARPTTRLARVVLAGLGYVKLLLALSAVVVLMGKLLEYGGYASTVIQVVQGNEYAAVVGLFLANGWFGWQLCLVAIIVILFQPYPGMIDLDWV